jgi:hypothetical protein
VVHPEPEQKRFDPKELNKIINEVHYFQDWKGWYRSRLLLRKEIRKSCLRDYSLQCFKQETMTKSSTIHVLPLHNLVYKLVMPVVFVHKFAPFLRLVSALFPYTHLNFVTDTRMLSYDISKILV